MVEIECLVCGKNVKLPECIDTDNYDGQVVCQNCTSLLHIKLAKSKVRQYKVVEKKFRELTAGEITKRNLYADRKLQEWKEKRESGLKES